MNKKLLCLAGIAIASFYSLKGSAQSTLPSVIPTGPKASPLKSARTMDQVIADDLIVKSKICVGADCVDGENFGSHTLRLKENNLRIGFDDVTTSSGFPANDWELEANDAVSGGTNHFAVRDVTANRSLFKVMAGAPENSLYVNSNGKIGLRTASPFLDIHMSTGDTPAVRFEQTNAGGFTSQTWDIGANEANFFVRDLTGGSRLPFRIRPGAPTSSIDISTKGFVGIGITSPQSKLHVEGNTYISDTLFVKNHVSMGFTLPSDQKLKTDVQDLEKASDMIRQLSPKTYTYNRTGYPQLGLSNGLQYGLIAQEVEKVLPALVSQVNHPGGHTFKSVNYMSLIPILIQGMKEQQAEIEALRKELAEMNSLKKRIEAIEASLHPTQPARSLSVRGK